MNADAMNADARNAVAIQAGVARSLAILCIALLWPCTSLFAQALPTATGPGTYIAVGVRGSIVQSDYGQRKLGGYVVSADLNPTWRYGFEAEARFLPLHTSEQVTETSFLVGPRIAIRSSHALRPYVKFLVGEGRIALPFGYAEGTFFVYTPGGGADYRLNDRIELRIIDFEYQHWQDFPYGSLNPYGVSAGVSLRFNLVSPYPRR